MVVAAQTACEDALRDLGAAATAVTEALKSLIQQVEEGVLLRDRGNLSLSLYMYVSIYVYYMHIQYYADKIGIQPPPPLSLQTPMMRPLRPS